MAKGIYERSTGQNEMDDVQRFQNIYSDSSLLNVIREYTIEADT